MTSSTQKVRTIVRSEQMNLNLENVFHGAVMMDFCYPVFAPQQGLQGIEHTQKQAPQPAGKGSQYSFIRSLGNVQSLINTLKFLKLKQKKIKPAKPQQQSVNPKDRYYTFIRPLRHPSKDEYQFHLVKSKFPSASSPSRVSSKLPLDNPKSALLLPNNQLIAIERKYINLYQIEQNLSISLKDFDSNGLGKKFTFTDIRHIAWRGADYVVIFGNSKFLFREVFLAVVFQVAAGRLRFVKRAELAEREIVSPTIIFQNDPSSKDEQKYCLVLGGSCDNHQTHHYSSLKIPLHLLLSPFLQLSPSTTTTIPFSKKIPILSGKAISFKQAWYCFCSQQQTINQIVLQYGGPGKMLTMIQVRTQGLGLFGGKAVGARDRDRQPDGVYFGEDCLRYVYEGEEDWVLVVDRGLEVRERSLNDLVYKFRQ